MRQQQPSRREIWSWAFYDFANSSYSTLIASLIFPVLYRTVIAGGTGKADFYWGLCIAISVTLAALASPIIGALADRAKNKKEILVWLSLACIAGTAALWYAPSLGLFLNSALFILTNFCYSAALVVYDSFLNDLSTRHTRGKISGFGWGIGYLGGLVAMIALYPLYSAGFAGENLPKYLLTFPAVAAFFLLFAIPTFIFLRSHKHLCTHPLPAWKALPDACKSLAGTLKQWKQYKNILLFLLAFYLLNDGLNTIFSFIPIYASVTLGLSIGFTAILYIVVQIVGVPATIISGHLSDRFGAKPVLVVSTLGWMLVVALLLASPSKTMMFVIAVLTGIIIGGSQAPARSLLAKLVPVDKACQFFGFNGFANKISASLGPVIFGGISWATGSQRWALASVLIFFVASIIVLRLVREPK